MCNEDNEVIFEQRSEEGERVSLMGGVEKYTLGRRASATGQGSNVRGMVEGAAPVCLKQCVSMGTWSPVENFGFYSKRDGITLKSFVPRHCCCYRYTPTFVSSLNVLRGWGVA